MEEAIAFDWKFLLLIYVVIMNIIGIALMWSDKRRAIKHSWRIKESTLFIVAILGGAFGACLGMWAFRHKTRHWYFVVFMPLILVLQIAALVFVFVKF